MCNFFTKRRFSALFWFTRTSPGANFHIGGRVCIQLFTYEIMSEIIGLTHAKDCDVHTFWLMKSCLCVTYISHLVCHIIFHSCTRNKVPHHDFLTNEPFSLCNFWLTRTSPCAICHIRGRVCLQRVPKYLTFYLDHHVSTHCVDYETCSCACSRTKKTCVCTLFELERHVHAQLLTHDTPFVT